MEFPCESCLNPPIGLGYLLTTPLLASAFFGHKTCLQSALDAMPEHKSNAAVTDAKATALRYAVLKGQLGCTELLLAEGAKLQEQGSYCSEDSISHQECIKLLIEETFDAALERCHTLLPGASYVSHVECLQMLLKAGCNVNQSRSNLHNGTALRSAACAGSMKCINILLEAGADVNYVPSAETIQYSALIQATRMSRVLCMERLIEAGADVNLPGHSLKTALHHAVLSRNMECIQLLLNSGADVNKTDGFEITTLMDAALTNSPHVVELMLKSGADVNATDQFGRTALIYASICDTDDLDGYAQFTNFWNAESVKLLLKSGATINNTEKSNSLNALQSHIGLMSENAVKDICMILMAAGEVLNGTVVQFLEEIEYETEEEEKQDREEFTIVDIPKYLLHEDLKLILKHMCREKIRRHLLDIDPHEHLFLRVPKLGLPSILESYMLYDVSFD